MPQPASALSPQSDPINSKTASVVHPREWMPCPSCPLCSGHQKHDTSRATNRRQITSYGRGISGGLHARARLATLDQNKRQVGREMPSRIRSLFAVTAFTAAAAVTATAANAQKKYDVGASDTEIKIGNIMPYSGPASAYG